VNMARYVNLFWQAACVVAHGAMSFPKPRQSLDGALEPWASWSYPCDAKHQGAMCEITFCTTGENCQGSCAITSKNGAANSLNASNGQSCYWFSNGCTVGCDKCDGTHNHVGHGGQQFLYRGMNQSEVRAQQVVIPDPFTPPPGVMVLDPSSKPMLNIRPGCDRPNGQQATICASSLRTVNTQAECGSEEDFYFYSPWRRPGAAPVIDACGSAGGRFRGQPIGAAGAQFENSSKARLGDAGSELPPLPSGTTWKAGGAYEVGWTVAANHGGGYAYRLAPADGPLTEEAFRLTPLDFEGESWLRWDGDVATQLAFNVSERGWETSVGTTPPGSTWRKNPIPSGLWQREGPSFPPVCDESYECLKGYSNFDNYHGLAPMGTCKCTGFSSGEVGPLLPNLEVVDRIRIPADLTSGDWVLQWRWDCEESDQIWASCSDVRIV